MNFFCNKPFNCIHKNRDGTCVLTACVETYINNKSTIKASKPITNADHLISLLQNEEYEEFAEWLHCDKSLENYLIKNLGSYAPQTEIITITVEWLRQPKEEL